MQPLLAAEASVPCSPAIVAPGTPSDPVVVAIAPDDPDAVLVATMRAIRLDRPIVLARVGNALLELERRDATESHCAARMLPILRTAWPQLGTDGGARRRFVYAARLFLTQQVSPSGGPLPGPDGSISSRVRSEHGDAEKAAAVSSRRSIQGEEGEEG